jgi:F-type H+-transporting ATPase subunit b
MELVTPGLGLIVWMFISFGLVFFILSKFAWPIIIKALKDREKYIADSLDSANKAKEEMSKLLTDNQKILEEAKLERNKLILEGKEYKDSLINEAKQAAEKEAEKIMIAAREAIEKQKNAAIEEMKNQLIHLSVEIAEKVLKKQLENKNAQQQYISDLLKEAKIN